MKFGRPPKPLPENFYEVYHDWRNKRAGSDDNSQVTSSTNRQTDSQYITYVKEGHPELYPEIKYGEAFDSFISAPSWSYFVSTEEEDVVEFSGGRI